MLNEKVIIILVLFCFLIALNASDNNISLHIDNYKIIDKDIKLNVLKDKNKHNTLEISHNSFNIMSFKTCDFVGKSVIEQLNLWRCHPF